ncbi:MAG: ABC transporter permease [Planctomycetia bacterium]|nr:MAG: ABC transporter permease [Planctomycetia bacterium]
MIHTGRAVLLLVRRNLRQHALSTIATALSLALAGGLTMAVFVIEGQTRAAFSGGLGFDAVLGGRGSPLQLVLNSVFHLDTSPGNIPWKLYTEIRRRPYVEAAVPISVGDNYLNYRIVGTSLDMFEKLNYQPGRRLTVAPGGRLFDPDLQEAVIGSVVAQRAGLSIGSTFNPYHGITYDPAQRHDDEYVVVGILEQTNTPNDRVIFIPIEGIFRMSGHTLRGDGGEYTPRRGKPIPDAVKEVSAVLLKLKPGQPGFHLFQEVNRQGRVATLAWPIGSVMAEIFDKLGWMAQVLRLIAYLVVCVAAASILTGIYNSLSARRRDYAILRALGARRGVVFVSIIAEAKSIAALGALLAFPVYAGILLAAALVVREQTGVVLDLWVGHPALWITPLAMIAIGGITGIIPARKAYATDVASNLAPLS